MEKDMMLDMERFEEGMDAPPNQVPLPPMAEDEGQGDLVLELKRVQQVEGGAEGTGKMSPGQKKKWRPPYWLLVAAASVIVLAPTRPTKDQVFPPELAMFAVLLCAICLILRAMKEMM
ncbi:unnamed protein product [Urochloa decumbens]|uniref:Uncharacterized protein n=1 Tax=Urochloa decumbens TaxID=240449 RepID=A0ABC9E1W4_9POAL